ncbi:MAG: hypothetical protein CSA75_03870 [Sorangium cellulosum]|nr:MAG: hypothetical protein CSA75_03870 [Sorangium cellulosum]
MCIVGVPSRCTIKTSYFCGRMGAALHGLPRAGKLAELVLHSANSSEESEAAKEISDERSRAFAT